MNPTAATAKTANVWQTMAIVFATSFAFFLFLQFEDYGIFFARHRAHAWQGALDVLRILGSQAQGIFVSGLLAACFYPLRERRATRLMFLLLYAFVIVYLVFNNIFYTVFFDHYQVGMIEGQETGIGTLKDSIFGEMGAAFWANIILAAVALSWVVPNALREPVLGPKMPARLGRFGKAPIAAAALYAAVCVATLPMGNLYNLSAHPILSLTVSLFRAAPAAQNIAQAATSIDIWPMRFGAPTDPATIPSGWREDQARNAHLAKKKNVVLFVLESVGSLQMLPDGKLDPKTTPYLASLERQMTAFTHIYDVFPGTVRSHVPLSTGGLTITWGSVYEEYKQPYGGPTIAGEEKKAGLATGLFSAQYMDTENLGLVYDNLPFDASFTPEDGSADFRKSNKINSWGVDERRVMDKAIDWVDKQKGPFFLQYMTSSTHHPYSIPKDFPALVPAGSGDGPVDRKDRYTNALHFTDAVIKQLMEHLKAEGRLEDTLVFVCGDHGEAFGNWHAPNMTHKNYIYDENIRNYLLVIDPAKADGPKTVPTIGSLGDLAPTIVNFSAVGKREFLGQNLYEPGYKEKIVYFHKNAQPELWGLRDGRWKFISHKVGDPNYELYDLEADPHEQTNVAGLHPDQLKEYSVLVRNWYVKINKDYSDRLKNFHKTAGVALGVDDLSTPGPKKVAFGYVTNKNFHEAKKINPEEDMAAWTFGIAFPQDTKVDYEWISPSGKTQKFPFKFDKEWTSAHVFHKALQPMDEGTWTLKLSADGKELLSGTFVVSGNAPLHNHRTFAKP